MLAGRRSKQFAQNTSFSLFTKFLMPYYYLNISDVCANLILRPLSLALFAPDEADPEV
jgi:hypothetical protein